MSEITQHDINKCLTYSCVALDLRQILTMRGIPSQEEVIIGISNIEGKKLAEVTLPTGPETSAMSFISANPRQEIIDFLNKADVQFKLLEMLTKFNSAPEEGATPLDPTQPTKKLYQFSIKCGRVDSISELKDLSALGEDIPLIVNTYFFGIISPCGLYRRCCSV